MRIDLEDWENGWVGLTIGLTLRDVDVLVERLIMLKENPDQHFHISSDYKGLSGVGDIEISLKEPEQIENMWVGGRALSPGTDF